MKYVRFKNLSKECQRLLDEQAADYCYIENYKHDPDFLVEVCRECGYPATLSKSVCDLPAPCGGRDVTVRCKCGRLFEYGG